MAGSLITFNKLSAGNRSAPTSIASLSFSLPFPKELSIDTEYGWETTELGNAGSTSLNLSRNFGADGTNKVDNLFQFLEGSAALKNALPGIGETVVDAALAGQGLLINPKLEVLFKGVKHRAFELVFDLAPTTATDSVNLIAFLKELHVFAAPSLTGSKAFFEFPKTTNVVIRGDGAGGGTTIDRGNCAITRINANMTPDGVWASFKNGKPVHVVISIGFLELDLPTKENDADLFGAD